MRLCAVASRHGTLGVGDGQRDRLFDQHVLAVLDRPDRELGMELRRQRHDDGVDVVARDQFLGQDGQAILLAGKAFGAGVVGVGNRMQRAERLQGADVVAAPISATKNGDTRFHSALLGSKVAET